MKSYIAIQRAIRGETVRHAQELRVSASLISKWQEPCGGPTDSGARNPLDTIRTIVLKSFRDGNNKDDALAPIHYLAQHFNLVCVPIDSIPENYLDVHKCLLDTSKENASLLSEICSVASERSVETHQAELHRRIWQCTRQMMVLLATIKEADQKGDLLAKAKVL